jgi:hypothetical protein
VIRRFLPLALALLVASPALADPVAWCDVTTNPILGRVLAFSPSENITPAIQAQHGISLVIMTPADVAGLAGVPVGYWRCTAAPAVVEMTAPQKATLDAFFVQQQLDAIAAAASGAIDTQIELKAAFLTLLDAINVIRQNPLAVLPTVTPAQARDAYLAKVEDLLTP